MIRVLVTAGLTGIALFSVDARLTPDSVHYLEAAESLYPDDYFNWGPLFPLLLAIFDPLWLNALLVACLVCAVSWVFRNHGLWAWLIALAVTALSQTTQLVYGFVWSEGPFIVFSVLFVISWSRYLERGTSLVAASVFLALALLTRHIGVVLFAVCLLTMLQDDRTWGKRTRSLFAVSIGPVLLYGAWLARNLVLQGSPTPERVDASPSALGGTLRSTFEILGQWVVPHPVAYKLALFGIGLTAMGVAVSQLRSKPGPAWVFGHFAVVYIFAMMAATGLSTIPNMDWRFLSPAFVPLTITVVSAVNDWYERGRARKTIEYAVLAWSVIWITAPNALIDLALSIARQ